MTRATIMSVLNVPIAHTVADAPVRVTGTRPALVRVVDTPLPPSAMLLRACAAFGLALRRSRTPGPANHAHLERCARWLDAALLPGKVALVLGPSGSGKSTVLRLLEARLRRAGNPVIVPGAMRQSHRSSARTVLSSLQGSLGRRFGALASAGLGDCTILARTPAELSEGQYFRLLLARGMQQALARSPHSVTTLLVDEFASTLDRRTARTLGLALARWAERHGVRVIAATAHDDMQGFLDPNLLISLDVDKPATRARTRACRDSPARRETHGEVDHAAGPGPPPGRTG